MSGFNDISEKSPSPDEMVGSSEMAPRDAITTSEKAPADDDEGEVDTRCGYGPWKPDCLQARNNSHSLLAALSFFTFVQGFVVTGINSVNTTTIERRFDMRSSQVAWISSSYDIAAAVLAIVVGYVAGFAHKGRIVTAGAAFLALGSFTMFLPHLVAGRYHMGLDTLERCDPYGNQTDPSCGSGSNLSNYLYMFIGGQVLHSVAGVSAYAVGLTYIDDNIKSKSLPIYAGIMLAFAALGPATAFIVGGLLLGTYVDIGRVDVDEIDLTPSDPGWVGAWWIGYVITFVMATFVAMTLGCFPRILPATKEKQHERVSDAYNVEGVREMLRADFGRSPKDVLISLKILFTNLTWIFITLAGIVESGSVTGFAIFMPKFLQFQFGLTSATAGLYAGIVVVPGAAGGHIVGGLIARGLGLRLRGLLMLMTITTIVALALSAGFLLRCDMIEITGVNVNYFNATESLPTEQLVHPCNADCHCTTRNFVPYCSITEGVTYFSPCHAGCPSPGYSNCSCVGVPPNQTQPDPLEAGVCDQSCDLQFGFFMTLFFFIMLATFISSTAGNSATIRCVTDKQRSFAYGTQSCLVRLLGNVPAPIVMGVIFDDSCLVWQQRCGETGSCWVYDNALLGQNILIAYVIIKVWSGTSSFLGYMFHKSVEEEDVLPKLDIDDKPEIDNATFTSKEDEVWSSHL